MAHPAYLREKARQLRCEKQLSIDEIAERLALSRSTIYYWIRDFVLVRASPSTAQEATRRKGNLAMQRKYRLLREAAYDDARQSFRELAQQPTFRDFICLYIAEGSKRNRNVVELANSDPVVVVLATRWIRRFTANPVTFWLGYHVDQSPEALARYWGEALAIAPELIYLQQKSNSRNLAGRTWRSEHGVMRVRANDTTLRARLQAWMDCLRGEWG